ncbi:MAG: glycosyltransferase family 2 protein [Nanoarchaeota archaeon]
MKFPKVSFVICTFNCKDYLERCIKSIKMQDYPKKNIEIIIVDSYSEDGTLDIAKKFDARIILTKIRGYMEGKGMPKSIGCENAKGEIVIIIDSDNALVEKDWIKKMVYPLMNDKEVDYAICRMAIVKSDNLVNQYLSLVGTDPFAAYASLDPQISFGNIKLVDREKYWIYNNNLKNFLITGGYYLVFRKKDLKEIGGYSRDVDVAYTLASKKGGANIAIVKNAHLHHLITKSFFDFIRKKIKWGRYYFNNSKDKSRKMKWTEGIYNKLRFFYQIVYSLMLIPAFVVSIGMLFKSKEKSWILHAPLMFTTTLAYIYAFIKRN